MTLAKQAGELLAAARGDQTRRAFAREVAMSSTTLFDVEKGVDNPTLSRLEWLGELYGIRFVLVAEPLTTEAK